MSWSELVYIKLNINILAPKLSLRNQLSLDLLPHTNRHFQSLLQLLGCLLLHSLLTLLLLHFDSNLNLILNLQSRSFPQLLHTIDELSEQPHVSQLLVGGCVYYYDHLSITRCLFVWVRLSV